METWTWIVIVAAAVVVLLLLVWALRNRQRRSHLQDRFGPEYDRTVSAEGKRDAERRLSDVERVLHDRGYPTNGDAEHQAAHVAVDHPDVAERYRHGRAMLESDETDTEHLRKAMIDFRSVFDELVTSDTRTAA